VGGSGQSPEGGRLSEVHPGARGLSATEHWRGRGSSRTRNKQSNKTHIECRGFLEKSEKPDERESQATNFRNREIERVTDQLSQFENRAAVRGDLGKGGSRDSSKTGKGPRD